MSALTHTHADPDAPSADGGRPRSGARFSDLVWLTWRQHRAAVTVSLVLAALLTGSAAYLAARVATINRECGDIPCASGTPQYQQLQGAFGLSQLSGNLEIAVLFLPLLVGVFLGVPLLAREHEQRTLLLAWSQDVTPQRWLWTKLALLGGLTAALSAAVSAAVGRMTDGFSIADAQSLFSNNDFLVTGMLPLTQCVVWFALGTALGAAFRRTLPAVFAALAAFVGCYVLVQWRYPSFMAPLTTQVPIGSGRDLSAFLGANALTLDQNSGTLVDASGHALAPGTLQALQCTSSNGNFSILNAQCLAAHHIKSLEVYQPGSRIPAFHLILTGGWLGLGAVALLLVWWLVRRTSLSAG